MKVLTCELFIFLIYFAFVRSQSGFIPTNYEEITKPTPGGFGALPKCGEGKGEGLFKCVEYHRCDPDTNTITPEINTNGFGLIDIRFGENSCEHPLDVCCKVPPGGDTQTSLEPSPLTPPTPYPVPAPVSSCGIRNNNGVDFKITGNNNNEAEYGEFPWMVAILKKNYDPSVDPVLAICGGSLIAPRVVLTAAHCVYKSSIDDIKIRAGEWDTQTEKERLPYQERDISEIILHENFKNSTLFNDVALLILDKPLKKAEHIGTICLPNQDEIIDSKNCFASGWGKDNFGRDGQYQVILKKIELPIVLHEQCQNSLRETRLGKFFKLDQSFTCAGGVEGKDTCTGDGGSPLVCPDPNQPKRYVQAGIVAWGIGCGTITPGVYADVSKFRNWIDKHMQRLNIDTKPYTS